MAFSFSTIPGWQLLIVFILAVKSTESKGISCVECNVYFQGRRGSSCEEPLNRSDCAGCMKVVTKIQMNDGWLIRRTSEVQSKVCARVGNSLGLREEGCYYQLNNGGYTEECFCYSDHCNKATSLLHASSLWIYTVVSLTLCAWMMR